MGITNDLVLGDSLEILPTLEEGSIDLILTDPPYNISQGEVKVDRSKIENRRVRKLVTRRQNKPSELCYDFRKWDNYSSIDQQLEFAEAWLLLCYPLLKDNGQIITFYSRSEISFLEAIMNGLGYRVRQTLVWHKTNPVPQLFKVGYMSACELILWATKNTGAGHTFNYRMGQSPNVFSYPTCGGKERTEHPTQKPLALIKRLLGHHTNEGDLVLDPFMGSGTVCMAAKEMKRGYIGIEKEEKYYQIAVDRLNSTPELLL